MPDVSEEFKRFGTGDDYDPKTPYGKCIDCREAVSPDSAPFCPNCKEVHEDLFPVGIKSNTTPRLARKRKSLQSSMVKGEKEDAVRRAEFDKWKKEKRARGDAA